MSRYLDEHDKRLAAIQADIRIRERQFAEASSRVELEIHQLTRRIEELRVHERQLAEKRRVCGEQIESLTEARSLRKVMAETDEILSGNENQG